MVLFKGLGNVIMKEVKELMRDPKILLGMILVPALMFPIMGFAIQISMKTVEESVKNISVVVMDLDKGNVTDSLKGFLKIQNVTVDEIATTNFDEALEYVQESNATALIVIPRGFSDNVTNHLEAELEVYAVFRSGGMAESASSSVVNALVEIFKRFLAPDPFVAHQESIVKGKAVPIEPSALFGAMMSQFIGMPMGVMILLLLAMQLAATSVAMEKEEKTLETLLTLPIDRFTILVGKLTGSVIVALVGAVAFVVGFSFMGASTFGAQIGATAVDLAAIGLAPTITTYLILGTSLFVSLVSALALAVAISVFAEDVRGAQALVSYLTMLLVFPMMFMMFTDVYALPFPLMVVLLAIPFTHPMLAARVAFTGDYFMAVIGIVYVAIFTVVVLYIAAKLFGTEKILTARLKFRRFRLRKSK
ncbi:ABC transporter permease [Candidatus Bathyarchaeota archaeon]|nr:ABC transporter permease [Candidatus Bathyarchaeota archaeon]